MQNNTRARLLAFVTGRVNQGLLLQCEYLIAENRILRSHVSGRLRLSNSERSTLAQIGKRLGRRCLAELACVAKPETILAWYRRLVTRKFRLTLWFVAVLAAVLVVYSATACFLMLEDLRAQLVSHAIQDLETAEGLLSFDAEGALSLRDDYHNHPESKQVLERLLEVLSPSGEVLLRNERLGIGPAPPCS